MKSLLTFISLLFILISTAAGETTSSKQEEPFSYSGFIDVFYGYDFNRPNNHTGPGFLFNHNRHDESNVNLALLQLSYEQDSLRSNLSLQSGVYVDDNLSHEADYFRNLFQAYGGISLNEENSSWIDVGIFSSHIGFESAISTQNYTLSRSLAAENSPYYLAGVRWTHEIDESLEFLAVISNGWQRMERVSGSSLPGVGTQLVYHIDKDNLLNWSTFISTDDPDESRRTRYFNNFYGTFKIGESMNLITGLDIGYQQKEKDSSKYSNWYAPTVIFHNQWTEEFGTGFRAEYFHDEDQVIITTGTENGFQTIGASVNFDYTFMADSMFRIELRNFSSRDDIFETKKERINNRASILASIAVTYP